MTNTKHFINWLLKSRGLDVSNHYKDYQAIQKTANVLEKILIEVSNYTGISIELIRSKTRKREVVHARFFYCGLACDFTYSSLASIGELIGDRDHSSIIHGRDTLSDLMLYDKRMERDYNRLKEIVSRTIRSKTEQTPTAVSA